MSKKTSKGSTAVTVIPILPDELLKSFEASHDLPLYLVGSFDAHVTVLSQQIRALNLAWCLVETGAVQTRGAGRRKLAIVGAGFSGLTLAAALLEKDADLDIVLFEERDTLLPLQQGSDSRWLHPQIYEWPADGSGASAAMLPILNWTAGRASDVVVQALGEWRRIVRTRGPDAENVRLFCNTRHLQIDKANDDRLKIEWVGDRREACDGTALSDSGAEGASETFDLVVLAVGFGLERDTEISYWRNETLGQPSLAQGPTTFLVSGQGDGAMIDLLRVRISQYRQDRILDELFTGADALLDALKGIYSEYASGELDKALFARLEGLAEVSEETHEQLRKILKRLRHRLRRDTDAVLHLQVRNLDMLFDSKTSRMSFQNALLVYLLYKCGGFSPSNEDENKLIARLSIRSANIIRRHGTDRLHQFKRLLSPDMFTVIEGDRLPGGPDRLHQEGRKMRWPGGYFGFPGKLKDTTSIGDETRKRWRKEYLPGPTALIATTICGAITGLLVRMRPEADQFRATLHRVLRLHEEDLLQQACGYLGPTGPIAGEAARRTFPVSNATIGQAFASRRIVRSRKGVGPQALQEAMGHLNLLAASRRMGSEVSFVLAIPILQPESRFFSPSPVAGVAYVDSPAANFWLSDAEVSELCEVIQHSLDGLSNGAAAFDRLRNVPLSDVKSIAPYRGALPAEVEGALELLGVDAPATQKPFLFNFEHSDLTPVSLGAETPAPTDLDTHNA